ncbi:hypothetical protein AbraIFM66951_004831 [Aspergillus brasiliensis]|uniref:Uncharacterized protein n=2 Tax=Aspergillus brasiliensis TaxID=319629 RepID=A0A1L9U3Q8_ASPBC|nr:hypothetical protein ASPBRDRAFT_200954 [Aspergillus brasiliensis CBS 101740]GKZ27127.1 hypothetical protein AbraCBS73388_003767 [Aspergillus brasiliensis]GKZ51018.1 hypothetical protein AbraIFM66951_004831 [Aspergillus brasiliensis]
MVDTTMEAFLNWGAGGEVDFPNPDIFLFDPEFDFPLEPTVSLMPPTFPANSQIQEVNDVPELLEDGRCDLADDVESLTHSVQALCDRVQSLENELQTERQNVKSLEAYIDSLQPFLVQLSSKVGQLLGASRPEVLQT